MAKHETLFVVEYNYRNDPKYKCTSGFPEVNAAYKEAEMQSRDPEVIQVRLFRQDIVTKTTALRTWTNGKHR